MTSKEEWEYYKPFIGEAEKDIKENGTISLEEFIEELKQERRERKLKKNTTLKLANSLGKMLKRYIRV